MLARLKNRWDSLLSSRVVRGVESRATRDASRGFTLLEIMIVLAIIGLIAGGVGVTLFRRFQRAQVQIGKTRVGEVSKAVKQYMLENNSNCPKGIDDLVAQKYLEKSSAKDPWGKDFTFKCPGTNETDGADITCSGPDKQEGTADDIKSWEQ
jgi:general secretion pathway protein G